MHALGAADKGGEPPPHPRMHAVPSMVTEVWLSLESLGPFTFSSCPQERGSLGGLERQPGDSQGQGSG